MSGPGGGGSRSFATDNSIPTGADSASISPVSGDLQVSGSLGVVGDIKMVGTFLTNSVVFGLNGLYYDTMTLSSGATPATKNYKGAPIFINPSPTGAGAGTIIVPYRDTRTEPLNIFRLVNTTPDDQVVTLRYRGQNLVVTTAGGEIMECTFNYLIGAPNNIFYFSYPLVASGRL